MALVSLLNSGPGNEVGPKDREKRKNRGRNDRISAGEGNCCISANG